MKDLLFNGKRLVVGPQDEVSNHSFSTDLNTNRNAKMVQTLLREDVNGLFLFYIDRNSRELSSGFLYPPGLSQDEATEFQEEFLELFNRYAELANHR